MRAYANFLESLYCNAHVINRLTAPTCFYEYGQLIEAEAIIFHASSGTMYADVFIRSLQFLQSKTEASKSKF